jgi:hypothetical protein
LNCQYKTHEFWWDFFICDEESQRAYLMYVSKRWRAKGKISQNVGSFILELSR